MLENSGNGQVFFPGSLVRVMLDRLCLFRLFFFAHSLAEILDAFGDVAHQFRNFATAKQQQHDDQNDQPVPYAKTTHTRLPRDFFLM